MRGHSEGYCLHYLCSFQYCTTISIIPCDCCRAALSVSTGDNIDKKKRISVFSMRQSTMQCPFVLFTIRVSWRKLLKRSAVLIIALFSVESTICGTC